MLEGMAKRKMRSKPELLVAAVPPELWQSIASKVSLKNWAKTAAPTCKALWNLQLPELKLKDGVAGMRWAAPRMRQPQRLLAVLTSDTEALELLSIPRNLSSLVELQFLCAEESPVLGPMALEGLLRQATALKALRTDLTYISPVPGLTHLVVFDVVGDLRVLSQTLPLFKSLQTLFLGCYPECDHGNFPSLHLDGLQQLRSVKLDGVSPDSIRLSKQCELHITVQGVPSLNSSKWTPVLDNLRSICFWNPRGRLETLPTIFEQASNCVYVSIDAEKLGTAAQPIRFMGSMKAVRELHLHSMENMHVNVPSQVAWSSISFVALDELDIRLGEDCTWDGLLSTVGTLFFRYKLVRGPWSVDLGAAAGRLSGSHSISTELIDGGATVVKSADNAFSQPMDCRCRERCGACSSCLEAEEVWLMCALRVLGRKQVLALGHDCLY